VNAGFYLHDHSTIIEGRPELRSKHDRQRPTRRGGFSEDGFYGNTEPPPSFPNLDTGAAAGMRATVKWYNPDKGFGFVELADGSGDVFLHAKVLQAAGHQAVSPGAMLQVRIGQGQRGREVEQVVSVDESTARRSEPVGVAGFRPRVQRSSRPHADLSTAAEMTGIVKWYNPTKGFGFISPQGGGKDLFVHATTLERAGMSSLQEGQVVRVKAVPGAKGPEVGSISTD
jgi:CspA family cold shock protein